MQAEGEVRNDEVLLRLLREDWIVHNEDGSRRVSSMAFKDRTNPDRAVSVFRKDLAEESFLHGLRIRQAAVAVAEVVCGEARAAGNRVEPDIAGDQHPSHALIIPPTASSSAWERGAKKLAHLARIRP